MAFFLVKLPEGEGGQTIVAGARAFIVEADSASLAKELCAAQFGGDQDWTDAGVTATDIATLGASNLAGWKYKVTVRDPAVGGAEGIVEEVEYEALASILGVSAVAIDGGGTGYTAGDVLTVSGGTQTSPCRLLVDSESGGVIDGVSVIDPGQYTAVPGNPVSVTGGSGSGATFDLTSAAATLSAVGGGLVAALNATGSIGGARHTPADDTLLVAAGSGVDDLGDQAVQVEVTPAGSEEPMPGMVGTITDEGASTDDLKAVLTNPTAVPAVIQLVK